MTYNVLSGTLSLYTTTTTTTVYHYQHSSRDIICLSRVMFIIPLKATDNTPSPQHFHIHIVSDRDCIYFACSE